MKTRSYILLGSFLLCYFSATAQNKENETARAEHSMINVNEQAAGAAHTMHPDALWYPDAGNSFR
jgi:hypothetical protein